MASNRASGAEDTASGSQSYSRSENNSSAGNPPGKYQIVTEGWGGRPTFQASFGLMMEPDDIQMDNYILDKMMEYDDISHRHQCDNEQGYAGRYDAARYYEEDDERLDEANLYFGYDSDQHYGGQWRSESYDDDLFYKGHDNYDDNYDVDDNCNDNDYCDRHDDGYGDYYDSDDYVIIEGLAAN